MERSVNAEAYYEKLLQYKDIVRSRTEFEPEVAIVLGSGLGGLAQKIEEVYSISYKELPDFPVSTAPGHDGKFILGYLEGVKVIGLKGRIHYYEGYEMSQVVLPLRLAFMLGAKKVIITNAVGGINEKYKVGDFVLTNDVITSFVPSPLRGENIHQLGERFVDMSRIYDDSWRKAVLEDVGGSREMKKRVHEGVLVQVSGPQFETKTEIKMYKTFGADICGMSSGVEAVCLRHAGAKILGISCVTNMATGISKEELSGEDVIDVANLVSENFESLVISGLKNRPK